MTETEITSELDLLVGASDRDLCWFAMNRRPALEITRTMTMESSPTGIDSIPAPFELNGAHQWYCLGTYP